MADDKSALDAETKKVLKAMKFVETLAAPKHIAETTGLDNKKVSDIIKTIKGQGLVESPVHCK